MIADYLRIHSDESYELEVIEKKLDQNNNMIQKYLTLLEKGAEMETVYEKFLLLEDEKKKIEKEKLFLERQKAREIDPNQAAQYGSEFVKSFRRNFETAEIAEKKHMIKQMVVGISVNPDKRLAKCSITKIPMVNQTLAALIKPSEFLNLLHSVGAHCSGGRNFGF